MAVPTRTTYSYCAECRPLSPIPRISVKRPGVASNFLHDHINVGQTIRVHKPAGDFVLHCNNQRSLVLVSNGIGATPLISMLHHTLSKVGAAETKRKIYWIHGAKNREHHVFKEEVGEMRILAGVSLVRHLAYSQPLEGDRCDWRSRASAELAGESIPELKLSEMYIAVSVPLLLTWRREWRT